MKNLFYLLLLLIFPGCSNSNVGLSGKVVFEDGSPLSVGTVCFETDTFIARGSLKPDGTYTVGSLSERDGLPAGKYRVYIIGAEKESGKSKDGMMPVMEPLIDVKYFSGATSGLTVDVPVASGKFNITVEPYTTKKK